jgi:hypothetical protein
MPVLPPLAAFATIVSIATIVTATIVTAMEPLIWATAMEMPTLAAAGSRHREPTLVATRLRIWDYKRISEGGWSATTAVWLSRSAVLLSGMINDGGVWSIDEEDGVPAALGGGASVGGSSVARCSSVRSRWGRQKWRG